MVGSEGVLGEVLDLNVDGMKMAIEAGKDVAVGQHTAVSWWETGRERPTT